MNSQLPLPPSAMSAKVHVTETWNEIGQMILDGEPYAARIEQLEEYLFIRAEQLKAGRLGQHFDWGLDLHLARTANSFFKDWAPKQAKIRQDWHDYWDSLATRSQQYTEKISQTAFTTMILLHGAVAVGAINVLSQNPVELAPYLIPAAKWTLFGALVGVALLILGQMIIFIYLTEMSETAKGRILGPYKYKRFRSLHRYWQKYYRKVRIGIRFIYGSIVWFLAYATVALIILAQG